MIYFFIGLMVGVGVSTFLFLVILFALASYFNEKYTRALKNETGKDYRIYS